MYVYKWKQAIYLFIVVLIRRFPSRIFGGGSQHCLWNASRANHVATGG
jgi:hypothetical protein